MAPRVTAPRRIPERDLSDQEKEARDALIASFSSNAHVICHWVREVDTFQRGLRREAVAVMKQRSDDRRLILCGCPLGAPPRHEGGASGLGTYEQVLNRLEEGGWSEADKRAIRAFIATDDAAQEEAAKPPRRRGKRRRK